MVLDALQDVWKKSLQHRNIWAREQPELFLDRWDASVAQLRPRWREHFPDEYKVLLKNTKELKEVLQPDVHQYGFRR